MASRPKGYGMTAELQRKTAAKYDVGLEQEVREWMGRMLQEPVTGSGMDAFHETLKDGILLCRLANAIKPGSVKKINESKMAFKQMENIGNFLSACEAIGCAKADLFQTVDLYEKQNMAQVVNGIHALGRKAQALGQPGIGPKESSANVRQFTDEQLRAGEGVIGLQMGSNKGASQAGQNFGKTRAILD
ncbi:transgelin [Plakobranchus ocellatus]|uniref:Transgelin n=1 Tax=Plakobranchus ocellatus TaxID=259542 RepID=A0AAV4D3B0_9GAST|nr:transgelin [Plakobranchus ocellatus]